MNGVQALVRLLLEQSRIDKEFGLKTKGYVSGYPGSPLGTLDLELSRARKYISDDGIEDPSDDLSIKSQKLVF